MEVEDREVTMRKCSFVLDAKLGKGRRGVEAQVLQQGLDC